MLGCVSSLCSELLHQLNCIERLAGDKDILKVSSVFVTKLEKRLNLAAATLVSQCCNALSVANDNGIQPWEQALKEKKLVGSRS